MAGNAPMFRRLAAPRRIGHIALAVLGAGAALFAGFVWYGMTLPTEPAEPQRETDAIVVLTGGSRRVETGLQLLADRRAPRLFVSGVSRGVERADILRIAPGVAGVPAAAIALGYGATDTIGNAVESAHWMRLNGLRSLRLVTATYHMRRSLLEFRHAMPEVELIAHPVLSENFKHETWWRHPGSAALIASEYAKFLMAIARRALADAASAFRPAADPMEAKPT
jgi:uncharacterized SAM-binding protein YcdF (DUF218 family)